MNRLILPNAARSVEPHCPRYVRGEGDKAEGLRRAEVRGFGGPIKIGGRGEGGDRPAARARQKGPSEEENTVGRGLDTVGFSFPGGVNFSTVLLWCRVT